ncbi:MAG: hypothetical protein H0W21_13720 [Actinobacteria bacterium]|nr:hypothetical protein [Actinomycetota bacterium]
MDVAGYSVEAVAQALPGREVRVYPALLSTESDALAWARAGATEGSVVLADYQASPRGRAGLEWTVVPGVTTAFSLILRPPLSSEKEGWLYTVATCGLADALGSGTTIEWPDEVRRHGQRAAAVGVHAELGPQGVAWAVVNVIVLRPERSRIGLVAGIVESIERRYTSAPEAVLDDYLRRLETIDRHVRAHLIPMGPGGPRVMGRAVGSLMDGALVLHTERGNRVAVRPQNLGLLEDAAQPSGEPSSD